MSRRHCVPVSLFLAAFLAFGCASASDSPWAYGTTCPRTPTESDAARRTALFAEAETAWGQRGDEAQLRTAIGKWEEGLAINCNDALAWERLSRAYYFLAYGHLAFDEARHDEMLATYQKGVEAAEKALQIRYPELGEYMANGAKLDNADVLRIVRAEGVGGLYWRETNLGRWASEQGMVTLLAYKDEIKEVMNRCIELDRTYFYAAPDRYFGVFFARSPSFAGRDLARSRTHFEASIAAAPNYFATRVQFAKEWAVLSQDRALFEEQLNFVVNADPNVDPDIAPENTVEQRNARALLQQLADGEIPFE